MSQDAVEQKEPGLLAFEAPSGIHFIRTDGTGLRRLPGTRSRDTNPNWSPDGKRLVFWNGTGWKGRVYVSDLRGSSRRLLMQDDRNNRYSPSDQYPSWSPNGRLIAFESFRTGAWHIWVIRPDGTGLRRVTRDGRGGYSPEWSPDSKRLVYTALWPLSSLAIVDLSGPTRPLKTFSIDRDWAPAWSPDGSRIAFTSTAEREKPELYVVGTNGEKPIRLTRNMAKDIDPRWSSDGEHIVFTSGRAGLDEVYVMRADGTDQRRITRFPTTDACCATWRPEP